MNPNHFSYLEPILEPILEPRLEPILKPILDPSSSLKTKRSTKNQTIIMEPISDPSSSLKTKRSKTNQTILTSWIAKMGVNQKAVDKRDKALKSIKVMNDYLACCEIIESILSTIEEQFSETKQSTAPVSRGRSESSWKDRSIIIYYHLHPRLGNDDYSATSNMFNVNINTLKSWLYSTKNKERWISMVKSLTFESVVRILPCHSTAKEKIIQLEKSFPHAAIRVPVNVKPLSIQTMNSSADSHQAIKAKCSKTSFYVGNKTKRILSKSYPKTIKHADATAYVTTLIESRWNRGLPINKVEATCKRVINLVVSANYVSCKISK